MPWNERIRLQLVTPDDAPLLSRWSEDNESNVLTQLRAPLPPHVLDKRFRETPYEPERRAMWLVKIPQSEDPVGMVVHFEPSATAHFRGLEVGWEIRPEFRGRGLATEATRVLVNYLFMLTTVQRIQAVIDVGNNASRRVAERAAMRHEGICRGAGFHRGQYSDMHLYAIVRDDWRDDETYDLARKAHSSL